MIGLGLSLTKRAVPGQGGIGGPPILALSSRLVVEGDSLTAGSSGPTWVWHAIARSRGRYFLPHTYNQATGGQTAAQMATQTAAITALSPKVVCLLAGTNDLAGTADTPATIAGNIQSCIDDYLAGGAEYVVVCKVLPRNDGTWTGLGAGRETDRGTLNGLIAAMETSRVKIVDIESSFNPTTDCSDGLHPNWLGAAKLGNAFGDVLAGLIVEEDLTDLYTDASNMMLAADNPQLTGTTGSKGGTSPPTGDVATGWTAEENGGMTVVCSKTTLNGAAAQRLVVSGTNSTNNRIVNFRNDVNYSGSIGEEYEVCIEFALGASPAGLRTVVLACDTANTPNNVASYEFGPDAVSGILRAPIVNPLAGSDTSNRVQCYMVFTAGAVAADLTVAKPYLRKVPSGQ